MATPPSLNISHSSIVTVSIIDATLSIPFQVLWLSLLSLGAFNTSKQMPIAFSLNMLRLVRNTLRSWGQKGFRKQRTSSCQASKVLWLQSKRLKRTCLRFCRKAVWIYRKLTLSFRVLLVREWLQVRNLCDFTIHITEKFRGRPTREAEFKSDRMGLRIGGFAAFDYFGDGSFYLLDAPGVSLQLFSKVSGLNSWL